MSSTALIRLPSPDNFPAYSRAVAAIPRLSFDDEQALARRWRDHGDRAAAQDLVIANLSLVLRAVKSHAGYRMNRADLAQEGAVGLMKAVQRFDPDRGLRLATYAVHWIDAEIREFILKNWRLVSWGTSSLAKTLFFGYRKTLAHLSALNVSRQPPTVSELAAHLDVSVEHAERARAFFQGTDQSLSWTGEDGEVQFDIPDTSLNPEQALLSHDHRSQMSRLSKAVETLPERERLVIQARLLSDPPTTLATLATRLQVSAERVRQIEASALSRLRARPELIDF